MLGITWVLVTLAQVFGLEQQTLLLTESSVQTNNLFLTEANLLANMVEGYGQTKLEHCGWEQ